MLNKATFAYLFAFSFFSCSLLHSQVNYIIAGESSGPLIVPFVQNGSNVQYQNIYPGPPDSLLIDLDNDSNFDFLVSYFWHQGTTCYKSRTLIGLNGNKVSQTPYAYGDTLFENQTWATWADLISSYDVGVGSQWTISADSQYAALQLNSGSSPLLAWMEFQVDTTVCAFCYCIDFTLGDMASGYTFLPINEGLEAFYFSAYFDPTNETVAFQFPDHADYNLSLMDITGRILKEMKSREGTEMDVSQLNTGVYFVGAEKGGVKSTKKIVIW